jgi:hypothetical protein
MNPFADNAMAQQYGGYSQMGHGTNPYDQRDDGPTGDRYNNYSQGRYDDRMLCGFLMRRTSLTPGSWFG